MKLISGSSIFTNALLNGLKAEGQRAWYGVSRDMIVDSDDLARHDSLEDERKGYKYDEVADIRSLLDQFMTTTAADKALACFKSSTAKMDEWNRLEVPDNNDILMFFRTRTQDSTPQPTETSQEETSALEPVQPQEQAVDRFATAKQPATKQGSAKQQQQAQQQVQGKKIGDMVHKDPQSQGDYRAQITGKITRKTLLQELAAKLRRQEAQAQNINSQASRFPRPRKYYDSADYP